MRRASFALKHVVYKIRCGLPLTIWGLQLPGSARRIGKERGRASRLIRARAPPPELVLRAIEEELPEGPRRQCFTCNELRGQYPGLRLGSFSASRARW